MSPCSAKIASASRRNASQPSRSPARAEAGGGGAEGARPLAEDLQAPEVDLLQLVELGREALEVEHHVVRVLGDRGRLQDDRLARRRERGRSSRMRSACGPTALRRLPHGRSTSARLSASYRSRSWSNVSTPRDSSSTISPRSTHGKSPTECRSTAAGQQRSKNPQPEHLDQPTVSCGSSSLSLRRRISLEDLERLRAAVVGDVGDRADPVVDLESDRRLAERLLVEPAVGLELQLDLGVGAVVDSPRELRVADRVAAAGREHEVRDADDLDFVAGELGLGAEERPGR